MSTILIVSTLCLAIGLIMAAISYYSASNSEIVTDIYCLGYCLGVVLVIMTVVFGYGICGFLYPLEKESVTTVVPVGMVANQNHVFTKVDGITLETDKHEFIEAFKDKKLAVLIYQKKNSYGFVCVNGIEFVVTNLTHNLEKP